MAREAWALRLEVSIAQASQQLGRIEKRLNALETKFRTLGATTSPAAAKNLRNLETATTKAGTAATTTQSKFGQLTTSLKGGFSNFLGVLARRIAFVAAALIETFTFLFVLAIPAAFVASIKAGAKFEDAMLRTATVAAGGIQGMREEYVKLSGAAREMAVSVAFSASEVADAMFELVSSGLDTNETIAAMPAIIDFAGAAMTDLTTSVNVATQIMASFGLEATDLGDISDVMVVALNSSTLTVERLQNAMKFAAPAAGAFGISVEQTLSVLGLFVDATKQGGIAGRAFRFAIARLAAPSQELSDYFETLGSRFEGVSLTASDFSLQSNDLTTVMNNLAFSMISTAEVMEHFGIRAGPVMALSISRIREDMRAAYAATGEWRSRLDDLNQKMADGKAADVARKQYANFLTSTSNKFKLLKAVGEEALIRIFSKIQPLVDGLSDLVSAVVKNTNVIDGFVAISSRLAILIAGLGAYFAGKFVISMIASSKAVAKLRIALILMKGGVFSLTAALRALKLSNPFLWVFLAIEIFIKLQQRFNVIQLMLGSLKRLFGQTKDEADGTNDKFSIMAAVADLIGLAFIRLLTKIGQLRLGYLKLKLAYQEWTWASEEDIEATNEKIAAVEKEINALRAKGIQVTKNFGIVKGLTEEEIKSREEGDKRLAGIVAENDLREIQLNAYNELTPAQQQQRKILTDLIVEQEKENEEVEESLELKLQRIIISKDAVESDKEIARQLLINIDRLSDEAHAEDEATAAKKRRMEAYDEVFGAQEDAETQIHNYILALEELEERGLEPTTTQLHDMFRGMRDIEDQIKDGTIRETEFLREKINQLSDYLHGATGGFSDFLVQIDRGPELLELAKKELARLSEELENMPSVEFDVSMPDEAPQLKNTMKDIGEHIAGVFEDAMKRVTNALAGALVGTKSWGDAFKGVFKGILGTGLNSVLKPAMEGVKHAVTGGTTALTGFAGKISTFVASMGPWGAAIAGLGAAVVGLWLAFRGDGEGEAIDRAFKDIGKVSDDLKDKIKETSKEIGRVAAQAKHLGDVMDEQGVTVDNYASYVSIARDTLIPFRSGQINAAEASGILNEAIKRLAAEAKTLGIVGNKALVDLMKDAASSGLELAAAMEVITESAQHAAKGLELIAKGSIAGTRKEFIESADAILAKLKELKDENDDVDDANDWADQWKGAQSEVLHLVEAFHRLGYGTDEARDKLKQLADIVGVDFPSSAEQAKKMIADLGIEFHGLTDEEMRGKFVEVANTLIGKFQELKDAGEGLEEGSEAWEESWKTAQGEALLMIEAFLKSGSQSDEMKASMEALAKEMGIEFPKSAAEARNLLTELGVALTSTSEKQEITRQKFTEAADIMAVKFEKLGHDVAAGTKGAKDAIHELRGEALHLIIAFHNSGDKSVEMRERMEHLATAAGIDFPTSVDRAMTALQDLGIEFDETAFAVDNTDAGIERLGRLAWSTFGGMVKGGASVTEAMDEIRPTLDIIRERMSLTGAEASDALKELLRWADLTETHKDVIAGFEGITMTMDGLAGATMLTQENFNDLVAEGQSLMDQLTDAGVAGKDAFRLMAPHLQQVIKQAKDHGLEIDAATIKLIEQAEEYGVLGAASETEGEMMERVMGSVADAINRLVQLLGGEVPAALTTSGSHWENYATTAGKSLGAIQQGTQTAFNNMVDHSKNAADQMIANFEGVEEATVGNTIFRDIAEKGGAFLDQLGNKAVEVSARMDFSGPLGTVPEAFGGATPNLIVTTPTPNLSEQKTGMSKFEKESLAVLKEIVSAVVSSGKGKGSAGADGANLSGLRQTISEAMRDASIDGEAEFHVDSIARLR